MWFRFSAPSEPLYVCIPSLGCKVPSWQKMLALKHFCRKSTLAATSPRPCQSCAAARLFGREAWRCSPSWGSSTSAPCSIIIVQLHHQRCYLQSNSRYKFISTNICKCVHRWLPSWGHSFKGSVYKTFKRCLRPTSPLPWNLLVSAKDFTGRFYINITSYDWIYIQCAVCNKLKIMLVYYYNYIIL